MSRRVPGRPWIRLADAAARLGLSQGGFESLAEPEGIAITQRYGRLGMARAELDAYLERCRIAPGS
jgi:hypothetical protein